MKQQPIPSQNNNKIQKMPIKKDNQKQLDNPIVGVPGQNQA